jgi:hypothetical protein
MKPKISSNAIFPNAPRAGSYVKKRRRLRISVNFMIAKVLFSYGTDSQKVQNRFLYGWYHSGIQVVFRGSG